MRPEEQLAQFVVESILPGQTMRYRQDQSSSVPDFDLEYQGEIVGVVEVTTSTDRASKELRKILTKEKPGDTYIEKYEDALIKISECKHSWWIELLAGAKVKDIRSVIDKYLARLEQFGFSAFTTHFDSDKQECISEWKDLGVASGCIHDGTNPPLIGLLPPTSRGFVESDPIYQAVPLEANKQDNRNKLSCLNFSERHLFVCIDHDNPLAWIPIIDGSIPDQPAFVPMEVTHIWAAALTRTKDAVIVLAAAANASV